MVNQACHPQYRKILEDITVDCVVGCENDRLSDDSGLSDGIWLVSCPKVAFSKLLSLFPNMRWEGGTVRKGAMCQYTFPKQF